MSDFGIKPQGFVRKPLNTILADIEAQNRNVFGAGLIQTSESPMGQINGTMADIIARMWEFAEDVYQSYDPDQAEGNRLEILGRLRLLRRGIGETDESLRQALTNAGRARIDLQDLIRAVRNVTGVTYVQVFVNDTDAADANGISGHSICVAVIGGNDVEIADAIRVHVVPGIGTHGNTPVNTLEDGACRTIYILRPTPVLIKVRAVITLSVAVDGCPPQSPGAVLLGVVQYLNSDAGRPINGQDITNPFLRRAIECQYANVEVNALTGGRTTNVQALPAVIAFDEIAYFTAEEFTVVTA